MEETMDLTLLQALSEADGIGGREKEVSRIAKKYGAPFADEVLYDSLGSLVLVKKSGNPQAPKVMLAAHMDEVGFIVRSITKEGYLRLLPVGGWWGHVMPAQVMTVTTATGQKYQGVIGSRAPHGMTASEKQTVIPAKDFYLDLGVPNGNFVQKLGIEIGDMVTPKTQFTVMNDPNYLLGKAWDDRICLGVALEVLKAVAQETLAVDLYIAATTQEEVGIRGARTATHLIKPDFAIALDVTTAKDTLFDSAGLALGDGVVLSILDSLTIGNPYLITQLDQVANEHHLTVHYDFMTVGGTDACNIHKALTGIAAMTVSIPTRYMHSSCLVVHKKDYQQTICLLVEWLKQANSENLPVVKRHEQRQ